MLTAPRHGYCCYARSQERSSRAQRRSKFRDPQPSGHAGRGSEGTRLLRLAWTLGWLDIRLRYRGSMLGPLWLTLSTGIMVGALGYLYAGIFHRHRMSTALSGPVARIVGFPRPVVSESCTAFTESEGVVRAVPDAVLPVCDTPADPQRHSARAQRPGDRGGVRRVPGLARLVRAAGDPGLLLWAIDVLALSCCWVRSARGSAISCRS